VNSVLTDRVLVVSSAELNFFQPGDKVLLIQMTGGTLPGTGSFLTNSTRTREAFNNAGKFEILQVDEIITGGSNYVVFTDDLSNTYDAGEKIQLVRLVEGENVTITGPISPKEWDGSTGGIVAIIGLDSVILNANIDVSKAGFRGGAVPSENYTGGCRKDVRYTPDVVLDTLHFLSTVVNRSGNKGEGIISTAWPYTKGTGFALNGGGAGNGLFSGGAGGGNFGVGGDGGQQSAACVDLLLPSWGGYACYDLYTPSRRQIVMGGGGGSGVKSSTKTASNGGDGGGIVIIITGILSGNGSSILATGESVSGPVTGSGGGGGAGGTVLLDVTSYSGSMTVNVRGGNGGRTNDANCPGSGGGGGGGILWVSGNSIPGIPVDSAASSSGSVASGCLVHLGNGGAAGARRKNLLTPLTGFLFNSIWGTDTLCAGQIPGPITGSQPKGGDGTYAFKWEQSTDMVNWNAALGTKDLRNLQPPALSQTTWYRRIVDSDIISDTSRLIEVYVYPSIANNIISGTDTICFNAMAKPLTGTSPSGGNNVYQYQWQYSTNQMTWNAGGTANPYNPGQLQQSRYFRRIVTSTAYCTHTSNTVKITVLPSITNNVFVTPDTVICENTGPGPLNARTPANGDGSYLYEWQQKSLSGNWSTIPSSNVVRYNPGTLTDTMLYRRIVFSGNDMACKDTSLLKSIQVLPVISNNLLTTDTSRYCAGVVPAVIKGTHPSGGSASYTYQWQVRTSGNWADLPSATGRDYLPDQPVEANTQFSRIIISGSYSACRDTSDALSLDVVPYIQNNLVLSDETICQDNTPAPFIVSPATGGLGGFTYQWIQLEENAPDWENAAGTADLVSYTPGSLGITTLFARKAYSDICTDISDTVKVIVYPAISSNGITGGSVQYTCFNSPKSLSGSQPLDGNGAYAYQWQQSINNADWMLADVNTTTEKDYLTSGLTATQYFRRIVYSSPINHECADTSDAVEVRINPLPSGDVISSEDTLCAGETLHVKFNTAGIHPPFDVTINGQTKTGISVSPDSMAFNPDVSQSYTMMVVVDDSGCVADLSGNSGLVQAIVFQIPAANAGPDQEVCNNTTTLQAVKSISGSAGLWSGTGAAFTDVTDPETTVTTDNYGTGRFTWTETNWHCTDSDEVEVVFNEQPQTPDAGPDQVLDFIYTAQLQAGVPPVGSGKWTIVSGSGLFSNDTLPDAVISELSVSTTLQWTVRNGNCPEVSDRVDLAISPLVIAKGFTPNGDTKNDYFDLGAVNAEWIRIKIFNSAGILVFESDDYSEGNLWDGMNMNGVELPEGTYFYVADIKTAGSEMVFRFRSFVEILR
jgi:gliding motility-associated-like protein